MSFDFLFKYIVVGDSGVGKTCILQRFNQDAFVEDTPSTLGIEFVRKQIEINEQQIMVQIWDTAGQENLHSLTKNYFRSCCVVLLVYDITSRQSFENITRWLNNIKENSQQDVKIILVGNKNDLEYMRSIEFNEGKAFAFQHRMIFQETSAKNGEGVWELFNKITHQIYNDMQNGLLKADKDGEFGIKYGPNHSEGKKENNFLKKKQQPKNCC